MGRKGNSDGSPREHRCPFPFSYLCSCLLLTYLLYESVALYQAPQDPNDGLNPPLTWALRWRYDPSPAIVARLARRKGYPSIGT
jgi:hypothetical protein